MDPPNTRIIAADAAGIEEAAAAIRAGGIVAAPTETVYGLAADAANGEAVARIYAAKGRPGFNPLIVHVGSVGEAEELAHFSPLARDLAARFWPGPLTLVVERRRDAPVASLVTAGLPTLALRAPRHPVMRALIAAAGRTLAAPSANASGAISPTRAEHVVRSLGGRVPLILDGGVTELGLESTIVALDGDGVRLLRAGSIAAEDLGVATSPAREGVVQAPGQLASHYAPAKPLLMNQTAPPSDAWMIGFGPVGGHATLSAGGDLVEAAAALFDRLHQADASAAPLIAVAPVPLRGVGVAINDRLRRAAAPR